jgi:acetyltransferase-like isoleucine patch superfamily enzyme
MDHTSLRRRLARSDHWGPTLMRRCYRGMFRLSLPAPRLVVRPLLWAYLAVRSAWHFFLRVFVCEPLFKAYCRSYGRSLRTGISLHWVQGRGDIVIGDNVWIDGKSTFTFAHRFADRPTLRIGDRSGIGHNCTFVIAKGITIGKRCLISGDVLVFDSSGHATDPDARRIGQPPGDADVREVTIGDDVWIGVRSIVFPGVRIGDGSVVSAGSVVRTHVPPRCVVAGNPARVVFRMPPPASDATSPASSRAPWMGT